MNPPVDTSTPRKVFPRWTGVYKDFWVDMFDSFCQQLISAKLESGTVPLESLEDEIVAAAHLADRATVEMQYRFVIQRGFPVPTRKKPRQRKK